jgi:hypothetical protein
MAGSFELKTDLRNAMSMSVTIPTGGVTAGEVLTVGDTLGFAFSSEDDAQVLTTESTEYTFIFRAEKVEVNKDSNAVTQGKIAYWDGTNVLAGSTGNKKVGRFLESATGATAKVLIDFDGTLEDHD